MKQKLKTMKLPIRNKGEVYPIRIVSDAGIATSGVGDGRLIPLLIIDTTNRPDVEELVRVHEYLPPGDAASQWGDVDLDDNKINLILMFTRPAELVLILEFDITNQGGIVDQVLTSEAFYLQPGRDGDRFLNKMENPRILVEVAGTDFKDEWTKMWYKATVHNLREKGMSRQQAKIAAQQLIEDWRKFGQLRMSRS